MKLKDTCSLEEKLWQTDRVLKSRDITLPTKIHTVKTMVFPVVMYRCESWAIKKAEYRRIDAFELWCWRRLLRVPWNARRSNQSILKEINPEYSLEGLTLKLKLQYFGKRWLIGKDPDWRQKEKGTTEGWDGWLASLTQCTWVWASSRTWWWTGKPAMLQSIRLQRIRHDWVTKQQTTYTEVINETQQVNGNGDKQAIHKRSGRSDFPAWKDAPHHL